MYSSCMFMHMMCAYPCLHSCGYACMVYVMKRRCVLFVYVTQRECILISSGVTTPTGSQIASLHLQIGYLIWSGPRSERVPRSGPRIWTPRSGPGPDFRGSPDPDPGFGPPRSGPIPDPIPDRGPDLVMIWIWSDWRRRIRDFRVPFFIMFAHVLRDCITCALRNATEAARDISLPA